MRGDREKEGVELHAMHTLWAIGNDDARKIGTAAIPGCTHTNDFKT
jgi:hypothetical protein